MRSGNAQLEAAIIFLLLSSSLKEKSHSVSHHRRASGISSGFSTLFSSRHFCDSFLPFNPSSSSSSSVAFLLLSQVFSIVAELPSYFVLVPLVFNRQSSVDYSLSHRLRFRTSDISELVDIHLSSNPFAVVCRFFESHSALLIVRVTRSQ
jgi:hypothetical protein